MLQRRRASLRCSVGLLLCVHAAWLAWSATWQSPTLNEPGHLASGLAQWHLLRFEPGCVNPPLVRMVAAVPAVLGGCQTDWSGLTAAPGQRCSAQLGVNLVQANGRQTQQYVVWGRWMLIPISVAGGWLCYLWGTRLYGVRAGILAVFLWCCEPNVIAHGQLLTTDLAATVAGLASAYAFVSWLNAATWPRSMLVGGALGLALLTKFTWLVLVPTFLLIWLLDLRVPGNDRSRRREAAMIIAQWLTALVIVNGCFAFSGSWRPLGHYQFASMVLNGSETPHQLGNRFAARTIGGLPVPMPAAYLRGIDLLLRENERPHSDSYLRGEWKAGGWWYYYAYAALVKLPIGLWLLLSIAAIAQCRRKQVASVRPEGMRRGSSVLFVLAAVVFVLLSSHTHVNHHFRYVLPCIGPAIIFAASAANWTALHGRLVVAALSIWVCLSSLWVAPWSLSYFNELAGGMRGGPRHLLHSNVDWGQGLIELESWLKENVPGETAYLAYYGYFEPASFGLNVEVAPWGPVKEVEPRVREFVPGWYAISVNYTYGCEWGGVDRDAYRRFRGEDPVARCGGSIDVFQVE